MKTCSYFNALPKTAMTSKQQNEASKKNCESMSYATLYEFMSMYAKSKTLNEYVNYESNEATKTVSKSEAPSVIHKLQV
jgi:hypothetical protein